MFSALKSRIRRGSCEAFAGNGHVSGRCCLCPSLPAAQRQARTLSTGGV